MRGEERSEGDEGKVVSCVGRRYNAFAVAVAVAPAVLRFRRPSLLALPHLTDRVIMFAPLTSLDSFSFCSIMSEAYEQKGGVN